MTFKQSNFDNSPVLREFAKTAQAKGLIKEDPLKKLASKVVEKKIDLKPSANLTDNVLKLCAGLRSEGLDSYATELETNLLSYKRAQATLYDTHNGETGDDLVDEAHPNGSHKMENIDSDEAVFETIIDNQLKAIKMVDKQPSGKLSSAQIIRGVKISLGEDNLDNLYQQADANLQKFIGLYDSISSKVGQGISHNDKFLKAIQSIIDKRDVYRNVNIEDALTDSLSGLQEFAEPGFFSSGAEKQTWQDEILPMFSIANRFALAFRTIITSIRKIESKSRLSTVKKQYDPDFTEPSVSPDPIAQKLSQAYQELVANIASSKTKAQALPNASVLIPWFDQALQEIGNLPPTQRSLDKINEIKAMVNRAQQKYSV